MKVRIRTCVSEAPFLSSHDLTIPTGRDRHLFHSILERKLQKEPSQRNGTHCVWLLRRCHQTTTACTLPQRLRRQHNLSPKQIRQTMRMNQCRFQDATLRRTRLRFRLQQRLGLGVQILQLVHDGVDKYEVGLLGVDGFGTTGEGDSASAA